MRCHEGRSWTFKGLVVAFVDLSVTHLLLCASALVYLSSKFLGLFGLELPCPCDGLFSESHKNKCFQETLVNLPLKKISAVQKSVKNRTPFDSILYQEANVCVGKERIEECRQAESEGEVSSTPAMKKVENASGFELLNLQSLKKGRFEIKKKRLSFHRSPYGLRYNHQGSLRHKNFPESPGNVMENLNNVEETDALLLNPQGGGKTLDDVSLRKSVSLSSIGCEDDSHEKQTERAFSWSGEGTYNSPVDLTDNGITQKTIAILEKLLADERSARTALTLELEKERNAAATAADEAMAMILRIREEKASIEMEARQYQRMIEEKSCFDAEEMSIIKEILLRREKEKLFLEKEVDTYRQMFLEMEQPGINTPNAKADLSNKESLFSYSNETTAQTLQPMTDTLTDFGDMETAEITGGFEIFAKQMNNRLLAHGNKLVFPGVYDNANSPQLQELQIDNNGETKVHKIDRNSEHDRSGGHEIAKILIDAEENESDQISSFPEPVSRSSNKFDANLLGEDSHNVDCDVHDIHVVNNEEEMTKKAEVNVSCDQTKVSECVSWLSTRDLKLDRSKSVSDTSYGLPPTCPSGQQNMSPNMRRNSMSAVDYERVKLESEVVMLRGRLRAIRKGREKLSFSHGRNQHCKLEVQQQLGDKTSRFWETRRSAHLDSSSPSSTLVDAKKGTSMTLDLHSA